MLGEIADKAPDIDFAQHRWCLAHRHRARTKRLHDQTKAGQLVGPRQQPRNVGFIEFYDFRDQQYLSRDAGSLDRLLHTLIYDAFMRGVLIDNDEAVAGLRDNVGLMNLGSRCAQWPIDLVSRGLKTCDRGIRCRFADVKSSLRWFRKTDCNAATHRRKTGGPCRRSPPVIGAPTRCRGRTKRSNGGGAAGRCRALTFTFQCVFQRAHNKATHKRAVAKTHFGLRRVHIHVNLSCIERNEQRKQGMPVARQVVRVGGADGTEQELVANRAPVDEQILSERVGP